jgi:hypothetical protein
MIIVLFSLQVLYAQALNQKMILSAERTIKAAADSLYKAEKFFQENTQAQEIKKMNKLSIDMELLEPYVLVTIKPITNLRVKNQLRYLLQSKFPQNFMVDTIKKTIPKEKKHQEIVEKTVPLETKIQTKVVRKPPPSHQKKMVPFWEKLKQFWHSLDSEWLGLIFLALAGFLLVFRSARQMSKIKSLQEEVSKYQTKIEGEMNTMRETHA